MLQPSAMCQLFSLGRGQPCLASSPPTNLQPFERMAPETANLGPLAGFSHCSRFAFAARVAAGATRRPRCLSVPVSMAPVALIAMCSWDGRVTAGRWLAVCGLRLAPHLPCLATNTRPN
ncbi:hypothetical protein COCMIDRAFT_29680 [Bipolaris oryzae ATCC 44560]|uniref:Uncharacterized protein n=1 Tax=Bipolaris oryzae ATCC 44560 TaxID=930090 RepID=W6YQ86_COCMI|nr:uncharacterized protein COCMIDRAFT_29680 [Bipolaris oryzae ATCC 44560]EUC41587.1 hypothetical protein COCMIDRAFT_29680 [Bipolaris oryzae ATCC 44560]